MRSVTRRPSFALLTLAALAALALAAPPAAARAGTYNFVTIDGPAAVGYTYASGINDRGQVVGYYGDGSGFHGFVRSADGKSFTTLDDPAGVFGTTAGTGINARGQIVGIYSDASGNVHGFVATPRCSRSGIDD